MKNIERFSLDSLLGDFDDIVDTGPIEFNDEPSSTYETVYYKDHDSSKKDTSKKQQTESSYTEQDIDKLLHNTDEDKKINNEAEYISKSIDIINSTMLDTKKKDLEKKELDTKRDEFEKTIQKSQSSLGEKYVNTNIKINSNSGVIKQSKNKYVFGESLEDKGQLFSIKIPNMTDYVYLNINVKITGKYNSNNTMLVGIANKKHYWGIERGDKNKLNWHYNTYENNEIQHPRKQLNNFGGVYDDLVFNIDFNKIRNEIKMYTINGNNEVEWIPINAILPSGSDLYLIVHRGSLKDQYTINNIRIDINKSFSKKDKTKNKESTISIPKITPVAIESETIVDTVCESKLETCTYRLTILIILLFFIIIYLIFS